MKWDTMQIKPTNDSFYECPCGGTVKCYCWMTDLRTSGEWGTCDTCKTEYDMIEVRKLPKKVSSPEDALKKIGARITDLFNFRKWHKKDEKSTIVIVVSF